MSDRRSLISVVSSVVAPVFIGLVGLLNIASQPRFETFHTADVVQLVASGMCFGAALAALARSSRGPRSS